MGFGGVTIKGKKQRKPDSYKGGSVQNSIIALGLEAVVQELRIKKGWGAIKIAKTINSDPEKYHLEPDVVVSVPSLNRYLKAKGFSDSKQEDSKEAINVYRSECETLAKLEYIEDALFNNIEACTEIDQDDPKYDPKLLIELSKSYREIATKKAATVANVSRMMEKVYSWNTSSQLVTAVFDVLKERDPMLEHEIRQEIKRNPMFSECLRKMKMEE